MSQRWDYIAKIVSIGDSGTGKSSLTIRLCEGRFQTHHDVTIGVEFASCIVPVGPPDSLNKPCLLISCPPVPPSQAATATATEQKYMKLSLWDTAGQETYKSITRSYFRGTSGALLIFDISRRQTFESVTSWLNDLRQIAEQDIVIVLIGNKIDLDDSVVVGGAKQRQVSKEEAESWAKAHDIFAYVETSAKSGENVENAFRQVAERIYHGIEAGRYNLDDRRSGVKRAGVRATNHVHINAQIDDPRQKINRACC